MFNTSLDLLYLALSVCAIFLTIFLCAALYQLIVTASKINRVATAVEKITVKGEELISFIRDRVGHSATLFLGFAEIIKKIISIFSDKDKPKNKKK
jgi:hypothetical protein